MSGLHVSMFGRLHVHRDGTSLACSMSKKARELFVYLLLHRRAHPREKLATLLWQHGTTERTKAYLRKALWQLRQSLQPDGEEEDVLLEVDGDWVRVDPDADVQMDVVTFERAFDAVRDCTAAEMSTDQVRALKDAAALYTGDLLENWYQEWCLTERERLKDVLLRMLDRLTRRCEQEAAYDSGIRYGQWALRIDPARERIHRQLMRLRARGGDRTGALRQYERCAEVLDRELNVQPTTATRRLHEQIQEDGFSPSSLGDTGGQEKPFVSFAVASGASSGTGGNEGVGSAGSPAELDDVSLRDGLARLRQLQTRLAVVQKQLRREVEAVEVVLEQRR